MRIRHSIFVIVLQIFVQSLFAQTDTSIWTLPADTVIVSTPFKEGLSTVKFDEKSLSRRQGQSLSELLNKDAGIFIKQYGAGMLATITHRGGNASQTSIQWAGVNILNPMLGQSDLSLLPIVFLDDVEWQAGGQSAMNGNNAIGGNLQLNSYTKKGEGWRGLGLLQIGSFGERKQQFRLSYSNDNYSGSFRFFYQNADNDYKFRDVNAFGNPKPLKKLTNAAQESWGLMQENHLILPKGHLLNLKTWYQQAFRQIPPTLLQTTGDNERQWDAAWRNVFQWGWIGEKSYWTGTLAAFWEKLDYESNVLRSESRTLSVLARIENSNIIKNRHAIKYGAEYQKQIASSDNYKRARDQAAIYASFRGRIRKAVIVNASIREQWVAGKFLLPALGANVYIPQQIGAHKVQWKASVAHNYRFPTLNDMYWPAAGNPDLLPEYSWSQDLQWQLISAVKSEFWSRLSLGAYSNYVKNWIQGSPDGGSGLWRPQNIATVWAYGPEAAWETGFYIGKMQQLEIRAQYQMARARRVQETDPLLTNKQLIYTPEHSITGAFTWYWGKTFTLSYIHNFFSRRYLDNNNNQSLPVYHIAWIQADYALELKTLTLNFRLTIDNLWGAEYQAVANRPMPRRMLSGSVLIRF